MGIRAWFTPVKSYNEFKKAIESIEINPYSIGINFIIQLNQGIDAFLTNTILIACQPTVYHHLTSIGNNITYIMSLIRTIVKLLVVNVRLYNTSCVLALPLHPFPYILYTIYLHI